MKYIAILLLLNLLYTPSYAAFKDIGWGARPVAMGGAFTAVEGDSISQMYNPAGISSIRDIEIAFMSAQLFAGLNDVNLGMNCFSAILPSYKDYRVGLAWANLKCENQYNENTLALSVGRKINKKLSAGITIKQLSHGYVLDDYTISDSVFAGGTSKSAISFDAGVMYRAEKKSRYRLMLGMAIKNINQPDVGLNSADIVPMEVRIGVMSRFKLRRKSRISSVMPVLDIVYRMQEWGSDIDKINIHAGCELGFLRDKLTARFGGNMSEAAGGIGFKRKFGSVGLQLDYTYVFPIQIKETQGSHRISFQMRYK